MKSITIIILTALFMLLATAATARTSVQSLLTEYRGNPLGIDEPNPRFTWQIISDQRGVTQSAYQVQVATSSALLSADKPDLWDSGKVNNSQSAASLFSDNPLRSRTTYYWRVRVWDNRGVASAFSRPVTFETAFLDPGEWHASWITVPSTNINPIMRREFTVDKPIARARAYVTGLGYYELRINGQKVGDKVLDPARTTYEKRIYYSAYDVTGMLKTGRNCAAAMLGKGWWQGTPRLLAQIMIDYTDATSSTIITDGSWKWSDSPIVENSLYNGETYDSTKVQHGWDKPEFSDSGWQPVNLTTMPASVLSAEMIQPIRVVQTMPAKSMTIPKPGVYVFDLGQNFSGWCKLSVTGAAGARVTMKYAELLRADGTVNQDNLRSAKATDTYILSGSGTEVYEPRFTYHGFRYVQVEGYPGKPNLKTVEGRVVCTDLASRGEFTCSNALINQIQHNSWWGERTNFHSIPTDCPQRDERQGWMGDAWMSARGMLYNFDMAPAYSKYLRDIADSEREDGAVPDTVPHIWGSNPGDPVWSAAYPLLLWYTYIQTGDKRLLEQHYDGVKRSVDLLAREAKDYIITRNNYGDWIAFESTPKDLISTGTFYLLADTIRQMADALGKRDDAVRYSALCKNIAASFNAKFYDSNTGQYGNGSQFSDAFPLYLGIVPSRNHDIILKNLVSNIVDKHKGHLSTGFVGTPFLIDSLVHEDRTDVAYEIITQETCPGWGYMVRNGATTIWELWTLATGKGMNSHNHPAFGLVSGWFYNYLAGIQPDPAHPGWEHFTIKPYIVGNLAWARGALQTIKGRIESHWQRTETGLRLDVTIPANTTATISIPKPVNQPFEITESGIPVWQNNHFTLAANGITTATTTGDRISFEAGSGHYSFELKAQ